MREIVSLAVTSVGSLQSHELDRLIVRLPEPETRRAAAMRSHAQQREFVVGRLLVRSLAATFVGAQAADVLIDVEEAGRPFVANAPSALFISIAHCDGVVVAAAAQRRVGVDVERVAAHRHPDVRRRVCSSREMRILARMGRDEQDRAFVSIWSRKEAYGKALGVGLEFNLRAVSVGPTGTRVRGGAGVWRVCEYDTIDGFVIAAAGPGRRWRSALAVVDWRDL